MVFPGQTVRLTSNPAYGWHVEKDLDSGRRLRGVDGRDEPPF